MIPSKMLVVRARIRLVDTEEGGRKTPFISGYRPNFVFNSSHNRDGRITLPDREQMAPGEHSDVLIQILIHSRNPYPYPPGEQDLFFIREGPVTVGEGIIQQLIDEVEFDSPVTVTV